MAEGQPLDHRGQPPPVLRSLDGLVSLPEAPKRLADLPLLAVREALVGEVAHEKHHVAALARDIEGPAEMIVGFGVVSQPGVDPADQPQALGQLLLRPHAAVDRQSLAVAFKGFFVFGAVRQDIADVQIGPRLVMLVRVLLGPREHPLVVLICPLELSQQLLKVAPLLVELRQGPSSDRNPPPR